MKMRSILILLMVTVVFSTVLVSNRAVFAVEPDFGVPLPSKDVGGSNKAAINIGGSDKAAINIGGSDKNKIQVSRGKNSLTNPLKVDSISGLFLSILDILLIFAVPLIVLFIMYAGFLYVTAQGDSAKVSTAHAALTWSVIGGVIVLGARALISVIQGTISAI